MNTEQMKPHQPPIRLIDTPGCRARVGCDSAGSAPVIDHVRVCWGGGGRLAEHERLLLGHASLQEVILAECLNIKKVG